MTIKGKLIAIGVVALAAVGILSAIALTSAITVEKSTEEAAERQMHLAEAQAMRVATLDLMLAAMDSIIDKDEGVVEPERVQVIAQSLGALRKGQSQLISMADTQEEKTLASAMGKKIDGLANGVQVDLVKLIETRASQDAFAAIDDVLDENGESLVEDLGTFIASVGDEANEAAEAAKASGHQSFLMTLGAMIVSLIVLTVALFAVGRSIINPINGITYAMTTLAAGDTNTDIPGSGQEDEIGRMAGAVDVFKQSMIDSERLSREKEERDRGREEVNAQREARIASFDSDVSNVLGTVTTSVGQMRQIADGLSGTADSTTDRATAVSTASEQASANVQTVATAAEELSASITEISRQVAQSSEVAGNAVSEAERTNGQVQGLANAADRIGEVVSLISDIAEQTNLLALNATIEAARAGEAGKGFAVVASEVKNLANQTAKATEEISSQISDIQGETREAVSAIGGISSTISQINEIASAIAAAVEEQGAATSEIARNVQQAAVGTQEVNSNIGGVSGAASETREAANQAVGAADDLAREADSLRTQVDGFLVDMRTG